jgi:protoporphyrinogen IX oxidase
MLGFHGMLEAYTGQFRRDLRPKTERYFRIINEIPTVLLIWIVVLVVVKPFS